MAAEWCVNSGCKMRRESLNGKVFLLLVQSQLCHSPLPTHTHTCTHTSSSAPADCSAISLLCWGAQRGEESRQPLFCSYLQPRPSLLKLNTRQSAAQTVTGVLSYFLFDVQHHKLCKLPLSSLYLCFHHFYHHHHLHHYHHQYHLEVSSCALVSLIIHNFLSFPFFAV